jgi:hypothetical protein
LAWVLPWSSNNYPGFRRGALELLGGTTPWQTVRSWRKTKRGWPVWALERVLHHVESRLDSGRRVAEGLREEIARQEAVEAVRHNQGVCEVGEDGRDRRGNWRR